MDLQMPGINGTQATHQILQSSQEIRILAVTLFEWCGQCAADQGHASRSDPSQCQNLRGR